jgi:S1-C subfamily serine protease
MIGPKVRRSVLSGALVFLGSHLASDFTPALAQYFHQDHNHPSYRKVRRMFGLHGHVINNGFLVKEVDPGSPSQSAGLVPGDFIEVLDGAQVTNIETFCREILEDFADDDDMDMVFSRGGTRYQIRVKF